MKPNVDPDKCIGCGTCESIAPNVFEMGTVNDKSVAVVKEADYEAEQDNIKEAVEACPTDAITI